MPNEVWHLTFIALVLKKSGFSSLTSVLHLFNLFFNDSRQSIFLNYPYVFKNFGTDSSYYFGISRSNF